jgi:GNAT superfamily N-acetyltransferase
MSRYLGFELIVSKVRSEGAFVPAAYALLSYHSKTIGLYFPCTLPEFRGKGLAQELLRFFNSHSLEQMDKNISCSNFYYE